MKVFCNQGIEFGPKLSSKIDTQNLTARKMFPYVLEPCGSHNSGPKHSGNSTQTEPKCPPLKETLTPNDKCKENQTRSSNSRGKDRLFQGHLNNPAIFSRFSVLGHIAAQIAAQIESTQPPRICFRCEVENGQRNRRNCQKQRRKAAETGRRESLQGSYNHSRAGQSVLGVFINDQRI